MTENKNVDLQQMVQLSTGTKAPSGAAIGFYGKGTGTPGFSEMAFNEYCKPCETTQRVQCRLARWSKARPTVAATEDREHQCTMLDKDCQAEHHKAIFPLVMTEKAYMSTYRDYSLGVFNQSKEITHR